MPAPVRTLGYATRREAFVALAARGHTPAEIAQLVNARHPDAGVTGRKVASYLSSLRRKGAVVPVQVKVGTDRYADLQRAADRRRMRPDHLLARILETVLVDNLVDAILDDGEAA